MIQPDGIKLGKGITWNEQGDTVTLGIDRDYIRSVVLGNAVYSINGQHAAPDGAFFIHGSECDSWQYGADEHSIEIADLCPACSTCDELYDIKKALEYLGVLVNMLKDVTLHDTAALADAKEQMEELRISGGSVHCADNPAYETIMQMQGRQLLQQYITVAHMWNYAVMQNNASFQLEIAPEDTAGFVVQTKRALPSCDGTWRIRCTVTIKYDHRVLDDDTVSTDKQDLSVFVPEPTLWFKPFIMEEPVEGSTNTVTAEEAALQTIETDDNNVTTISPSHVHITHDSDCTTKIIQTDFIRARVAGTYGLQLKFLPFINFVMYSGSHVFTVRGSTISIDGVPIGDNIYYNFAPTSVSRQPIVAPTKADYINAKTAPTSSVPFNNVWRVEILWEVGKPTQYTDSSIIGYEVIDQDTSSVQGNEVPLITSLVPGATSYTDAIGTIDVPFQAESFFQYRETRMYTTTGAREPNSQAIISNTSIPKDIPIEPTT